MHRLCSASLLCLVLLAGAARDASAQNRSTELRLEDFVEQVARFWAEADVTAIVELIPEGELLLLDAGTGTEPANSRHAAAALRALFAENETMETRAVRVTVASTSPARGFGELSWTYRERGAPGEQSRSVYVAALQQDGTWRITELRLMP